MPTFLSDPPSKLYIALAFLAALLGAIGFLRRSHLLRIGAVVVLVILVALFLCDKFFESPREEATRKIKEISAATKAKKLDDAFKHVSESFSYKEMNKKALYDRGKFAQSFDLWAGLEVDGFDRTDVKTLDDKKVQIGFNIWPGGAASFLKEYFFYCKATFIQEGDGEYRLQTLELFKDRAPDAIPVVPDHLR